VLFFDENHSMPSLEDCIVSDFDEKSASSTPRPTGWFNTRRPRRVQLEK